MERNTRQRDAIRAVFERADRPLSPLEIHERADRIAPGLSLATVYRSVKAMIEDGSIVPVELPGQPPRYEPAGLAHHHHFQCRSCGKVFDIEGCPGAMDGLAPEGFVVESHEITLSGLCAACAGG